MRVLLVGEHEGALKIYQKMLADIGIQADIGDVWTDEHTTVVHLWPMNPVRLREHLRTTAGAAAK